MILSKGLMGLAGDSKELSPSLGGSSPTPREYIRHLNYQELEDKYAIQKYIPRYIHNENYSTPVLKDMIGTKPIYSEVSKKIRLRQKRAQRRQERHEKIARKLKKYDKDDDINEIGRMLADDLVFKNPWDSYPEQNAVESQIYNDQMSYPNVRNYTTKKVHDPEPSNMTRRTTLADLGVPPPQRSARRGTVGNIGSTIPEQKSIGTNHRLSNHNVRPMDSEDEMHPLVKSNSYDQTKSSMTKDRRRLKSLKQRLISFSSKKRFNEQIEVVTENVNNGHTGQIQQIQYTQSQMVGHGSFGVVFQTQILPSNEIAAMKRVLQDKRFKNRELQIMKLVHHRNIADLKYYFYTNNDKNELYLNLILEFVPETLYKASHYYVSKRLSMPPLEVKLYTYQMFRALNYIHSQGICHRDIKPQNLLINPETGELKLCDFGSAKILNPNEPNVSYICSRYYRAPELIFGATNYTTKIDVWSAGCVMAELILGQPLFPGDSGIDQLVEIIKILGTPSKDQIKNMNSNYTEHKFPQIKPIPLTKIFKKITPDTISFLIKVLQYSPIDRVSCVEALIDGYFDELRNEDLKLPNYRKIFSQQFHSSSSASSHSNNANYQIYANQPDLKPIPELFDFDDRELSVAPELNNRLIPHFAFGRLRLSQNISSLQDFVPMNAELMQVTLE